jgi:glycosyltransferase involved in cell wall biosynthesis
MNVAYVLPIRPPKLPTAEALNQEIALYQAHFGGTLHYANPNAALALPVWLRLPRLLFGWGSLRRLRRADVVHFFNPDPFPYPFLLALRRPVVYSITGGVDHCRFSLAYFRRMAVVAVPDERGVAHLRACGLTNVLRQPAAVAVDRFTHHPLPLPSDESLRLLVASAPWTLRQFATKGFDALLEVARIMPDLRLTLLWRGVLADEIRRRVDAAGVADRVAVVDGLVDVNALLGQVHAAALFATQPAQVKAYPHSLLDALAAGKPVLTNRVIPMSDYVEATGCGVVIDRVTPAAIAAGLAQLRATYADCAAAAQVAGRRDFSPAAACAAVAAIYAAALARWSKP